MQGLVAADGWEFVFGEGKRANTNFLRTNLRKLFSIWWWKHICTRERNGRKFWEETNRRNWKFLSIFSRFSYEYIDESKQIHLRILTLTRGTINFNKCTFYICNSKSFLFIWIYFLNRLEIYSQVSNKVKVLWNGEFVWTSGK